eukprot:20470-Heterococcus_DN1.PRE.1
MLELSNMLPTWQAAKPKVKYRLNCCGNAKTAAAVKYACRTQCYSTMLSGMRTLYNLLVFAMIISVVMARDFYKMLGIKRSATEKQIKSAYHKQALKWHPDKHKSENSEKASKKSSCSILTSSSAVHAGLQHSAQFAEIAAAYEVLSDPDKRKLYDQYGEDGLKPGFGTQLSVATAHLLDKVAEHARRLERHASDGGGAPGGFGGQPGGFNGFPGGGGGGFQHFGQQQCLAEQCGHGCQHSTQRAGIAVAIVCVHAAGGCCYSSFKCWQTVTVAVAMRAVLRH